MDRLHAATQQANQAPHPHTTTNISFWIFVEYCGDNHPIHMNSYCTYIAHSSMRATVQRDWKWPSHKLYSGILCSLQDGTETGRRVVPSSSSPCLQHNFTCIQHSFRPHGSLDVQSLLLLSWLDTWGRGYSVQPHFPLTYSPQKMNRMSEDPINPFSVEALPWFKWLYPGTIES